MKWIVFFVVLLGIAASASAQELAGRVVDAADGRPLAGAILLAADSTGRQAGYTTSAADGAFRLRPRQGMRAAWIDVSMMGYRAQRFNAARLPQEIRLAASAVEIREVEIRAPRLSLRGDTVSYNVASFTEAQDRTIADVLRKMPGIEIEKTGEIRYNGEAINKFYIEGMDMLDGRYSLATNNIAPQDVASVEVMENHQPIKALRDVLYSDRAVLNLRLKKQARAHWTGTLRGAGGWSPDEVLGSGSAFAMRIAARSQSMLNLKGDNTGEDPTSDLRQLTVEEMLNGADNRYETPEWFTTGLSKAPLDDRRTRLNRSVMASADYLRKLTEDYQLSGHVAWGYDRLTSDYASRIVRYLANGELAEELAEQARLTDRQLAAQVKLLANTERFYLMDRLSADLAWSDFDARTTGSYPNRQQTEAPTHRVENDLNYIRRTGRRTFTVTSNLLWLTQPQQLDVVREGSAQWQTLDVDLLRMNHNVAWGLEAGRRWVFQFKGGVAALYRRFDAALSGLGVETSAPLTADTHFGYGSRIARIDSHADAGGRRQLQEPAQRHFRPPLPPAFVVRSSVARHAGFRGRLHRLGAAPRSEPHGFVEPRVGREHQHRRPARPGGGRSYVERHADGDQPAGRPDALPLGRADPLAAGESPRSRLAQRRIYVQLPLHAAADRIRRSDRPSCVRPAAAAQLHAGPKSGSATDRRALPHAALRHAEQAPRAGRCLGTLEGRPAVGTLGRSNQPAQ